MIVFLHAASIKYITRCRIVFVIGTPLHRNIGDLAIAYAEKKLINSIPGHKAVSVPMTVYSHKRQSVLSIINPGASIAGYGGGNMGSTYPGEEECRRSFISGNPKNNIVIFPQTIDFPSDEAGKKELDHSASIYNRHDKLSLIVREDISYNKYKDTFNGMHLTPDIVLSLNIKSPKEDSRAGALLCMRNDIEKSISDDAVKQIEETCFDMFTDVRYTDTISHDRLFKLKPKSWIVKSKLKEFAGAKIVITDRLHGMVFSAVTGTPCIALTNSNHKVKGTFEWIKDLGYVKYVDDASSITKESLSQAITAAGNNYDPGVFDKYWDSIKEMVARP